MIFNIFKSTFETNGIAYIIWDVYFLGIKVCNITHRTTQGDIVKKLRKTEVKSIKGFINN